MFDETQARLDICLMGRRMYENRMVAANDGNLSCRLGGDKFLCTPSGLSKGYLAEDLLIIVNSAGEQLSGSMPCTSEIKMHLRIYKEMPDVNAVAHAHPPHVTAFAITGTAIPANILPEVETLLGPIPTAKYATPGSCELPDCVAEHLAPGITTMMLDHHGAVAFDKTITLAYEHLETFEAYCQILLLAMPLGGAIELSPYQITRLMANKKRMGLDDPRY